MKGSMKKRSSCLRRTEISLKWTKTSESTSQHYSRLFYNLIVKIFNRLSSKFKAKPPPKNIKISSAYY